MKTAACSVCGAKARIVRGEHRFAESGLRNVVLCDVELIRCPECKNEDPVIPRLDELLRTLAQAVASQPYRLRGADIRFLRKYLKMTQADFASLLHIHKTNLSKWENDEDLPSEQSDRLIRTVVLALGAGLEDKIREVVQSFPKIRNTGRRKIAMDSRSLEYEYA